MGRGAASAFAVSKACCSSPQCSSPPEEGEPQCKLGATATQLDELSVRADHHGHHSLISRDEAAAASVVLDGAAGRLGELDLLCSDGWVVPPFERLSPLQAARLRLCLSALLSTRLSAESHLWPPQLDFRRSPDVDVLEIIGGHIKTGVRLVFSRAARDLALSERGALVLHPGSFMRSTGAFLYKK